MSWRAPHRSFRRLAKPKRAERVSIAHSSPSSSIQYASGAWYQSADETQRRFGGSNSRSGGWNRRGVPPPRRHDPDHLYRGPRTRRSPAEAEAPGQPPHLRRAAAAGRLNQTQIVSPPLFALRRQRPTGVRTPGRVGRMGVPNLANQRHFERHTLRCLHGAARGTDLPPARTGGGGQRHRTGAALLRRTERYAHLRLRNSGGARARQRTGAPAYG